MTTRWSVLLTALLVCAPALGQSELSGRWKDDGKAYFTLHAQTNGGYVGTVRSPRDLTLHGLLLTRSAEGQWSLDLNRPAPVTEGIAGRLEAPAQQSQTWETLPSVMLTRNGKKLRSADKAWEIKLPRDFDADSATLSQPNEAAEPDAAPVQQTHRPLVRVLITGFDRFPRPKNHPRWIQDGNWDRGTVPEPRINPAGWAVRQFSLEDLDPEFRSKFQVELHKCLDVPVTYVAGAKLITDTIERVDADVVISFGVGSNGNADADVEKTCENLMDDADDPQGESLGPFQLDPSWPPANMNRGEWTPEERVWLLRYPDNAGVSYNGARITADGPERRTSLLPVDRIIKRMKAAREPSLNAIDGGWGPGRYICNNVMYKVIETQEARGKLGGFIHLAQWNESKRQKYLTVVAQAVEESARQFVEDLAAEASLPIETPVTLER